MHRALSACVGQTIKNHERLHSAAIRASSAVWANRAGVYCMTKMPTFSHRKVSAPGLRQEGQTPAPHRWRLSAAAVQRARPPVAALLRRLPPGPPCGAQNPRVSIHKR